MKATAEIISILKQIPIFYPFTDKDLIETERKVEIRNYNKGETIYREGEEGGVIYILVSGRLRIRTNGRIINYLGRRGDFFGEHSLMTGDRHSVTVEAVIDSEIFIISKHNFDDIVSKAPEVGFQISKILSDRLQERYEEGHQKEKITIAVYSGSSRSGTSILAINLASGIQSEKNRSVILVDTCALEKESASELLHLKVSKDNVNVLFDNVSSLSSNSIGKYIYTTRSGMKVLNYNLSKDDIAPLFSLLQENYDCIVIDLPHTLTEQVKKIMEQSDKILFVCNIGDAGISKSIEDLRVISEGLRIPNDKIRIGQIFIREEDRVNSYKVEKAINRHIDFHLVFEPRVIMDLKKTGIPFVVSDSSLLISQNIKNLIRDIIGEKIGIALGSGTARGFAHIGVLKVLRKAGIPIDVVSGTSMGAFLGSIFAYGLSPETMEKIATERFPYKKSIVSLLDMVVPKYGLINGTRIINFLKSIIGTPLFLDLKVPLSVVACELLTGNPVVFRSGPVLDAIRASISFPGIFEPYNLDGKLLVDGAIIEPVPVKALKEIGVNRIIAVDVIPEQDKIRKSKPNVFEVVFRIMEVMEAEIVKKSIEGAEFIIKPDISSFGSLDFYMVKDVIKAGEVAAEESLPHLLNILK